MVTTELSTSERTVLGGTVCIVVWLLAEISRFSSAAVIEAQVATMMCLAAAIVIGFRSKGKPASKTFGPNVASQGVGSLLPKVSASTAASLAVLQTQCVCEMRQPLNHNSDNVPANNKNDHAFTIGLNKAIAAFGRAGDLKKAESMFHRATGRGMCHSVITYNSMIRACVESSADRSLAEEYMSKLLASDVEPDAMSFNTMIDACVKTLHGRRLTQEVTMWFGRMVQRGVAPTEVTFGTIIHAHAKARDVTGAVKWLNTMEATGVEVNLHAYSSVLFACARSKVPERRAVADEVFARMRARGVQPNVVVYTAMARGASRDGDYLSVERLLEQMEAKGLQINAHFLDCLLWSYVDARPRQTKRVCAAFERYAPEIARAEGPGKHLWAPLLRCFGEEMASQMWSEAVQPVRAAN